MTMHVERERVKRVNRSSLSALAELPSNLRRHDARLLPYQGPAAFRGRCRRVVALMLFLALLFVGCGDWVNYAVDSSGRPVRETWGSGRLVYRDTDYRYDLRGLLVEVTGRGVDGRFLGRSVFKYDSEGKLLERRDYDEASQLVGAHNYSPREAARFQATLAEWQRHCRDWAARHGTDPPHKPGDLAPESRGLGRR